jgi:hypothetical protein
MLGVKVKVPRIEKAVFLCINEYKEIEIYLIIKNKKFFNKI